MLAAMMPTITAQARQQGLSLVELMIGIALGLFLLASASTVMVSQIGEHRRLMLETRTEQDLRAIAELMQRELRQAGAWPNAWRSHWSEANPQPMANPYAAVSVGDEGRRLEFRVSAALLSPGKAEDDVFVPANESRGFAYSAGVLRARIGSNWQPLSDPETLRVLDFRATLNETPIALSSACAKPCDGLADCPPRATLRDVRIQLDAEAAHDASVKRRLDFQVRLQADEIRGVCRP